MENHHFWLVNQLFLWPCSIAMLNYRRVFVEWLKYVSTSVPVTFGLF
jgi:hypothetical protein